MSLSLVDREKLSKDPRKLVFLFPKLPLVRYKSMAEDYHRGVTVLAAERIASMFNSVLLPSTCVHHSRRRPERRLMLYGRTYYIVERDLLTPTEWKKYQEICKEEIGGE